jgi:hypothetical protein
MARPVSTLTHAGEDWQAILTGGCTSCEDYSIGVLFVAKTTDREAFGRLRAVHPEHFARPRQNSSKRPHRRAVRRRRVTDRKKNGRSVRPRPQ